MKGAIREVMSESNNTYKNATTKLWTKKKSSDTEDFFISFDSAYYRG
jgi:hypothetical protein